MAEVCVSLSLLGYWSIREQSYTHDAISAICCAFACVVFLYTRGILGWLLVIVFYAPTWGRSLRICPVWYITYFHSPNIDEMKINFAPSAACCTAWYESTSLQRSLKENCSLHVSVVPAAYPGYSTQQWCHAAPGTYVDRVIALNYRQ